VLMQQFADKCLIRREMGRYIHAALLRDKA